MFDGREQGVEILGAAQLVNRFGVALVCNQPLGSLPVELAQPLRRLALQALVQRTAQHRVVAVGQAFAVVVFDEHILTLQLADQPRSLGVAAELPGKFGIEGVDHRGAFQKGHQCRWQMTHYLLVEELADMGDGLLRVVGAEAEQDPADPAFVAGAQLVDGIAVERKAAGLGQLAGFRAVQGQAVGFDHMQVPIAAQVAEGKRG
ncbi:hypothetical protein D3C76_967790 [compost metagenome]